MNDPRPEYLTPGRLGDLELRNRIIKAATFEGMCPDGRPTDALLEHHREIAGGGAGMTTVAYCSVSPEGRTYGHQMLMSPEIVPGLKKISDAIPRRGRGRVDPARALRLLRQQEGDRREAVGSVGGVQPLRAELLARDDRRRP